jgi:hypothetical protein
LFRADISFAKTVKRVALAFFFGEMSPVQCPRARVISKFFDIAHLQLSAADTQLSKASHRVSKQPAVIDFWQRPIPVAEVVITSIILILLCVAGVTLWAHYPYYPCCFHQLSAGIRHWDFRGLDPSQPKEFWGFSYLSALVAAITRLPDILAIVVVSSVSFVISNYLCCRLWGTTVGLWLTVVNYWWIDTATQGMTEPLFMALLLGSFMAFRKQQSATSALLASAATAVRPVGIFALIAIGIVLGARRQYRQLAGTIAIGLIAGILYIFPMILIYGDPLVNVAGYHKSDWSSGLPLTIPLFAIIKEAATEPINKLQILRGAWVLVSTAATIKMMASRRFWDYARTYPAEALFALSYALFIFSYDTPWNWLLFARFVIPILPFLLLFALDRLPRDRRILWGVGLINVWISVWPKILGKYL